MTYRSAAPLRVLRAIAHLSLVAIFTSSLAWAQGGGPTSAAAVSSSAGLPVINPLAYGARFDNASDDTDALQRACSAASTNFALTGVVTVVQLPAATALVSGQIKCGSGVYLRGPARIHVPLQKGWNILFENASYVTVEGLTFQIDNVATVNNYQKAALYWNGTVAGSYQSVTFRNNVVHNSTWGIAVVNDIAGSSLRDVTISNNVVDSPSGPYVNFDGIHLEGSIHGFQVVNNTIRNRDDNAIGINGLAAGVDQPSDGVVANNLGVNNVIGINATGARNTAFSGNWMVSSVTATGRNHPAGATGVAPNALIILTQAGLLAGGNTFSGNTLINGAGCYPYRCHGGTPAGYDVAIDFWSYPAASPNAIRNNRLGTQGVFLRSNGGQLSGNTFGSGAYLELSYDALNSTGATNWSIGKNSWLGAGTIQVDWSSFLGLMNTVAPQWSMGKLTYRNQSYGLVAP